MKVIIKQTKKGLLNKLQSVKDLRESLNFDILLMESKLLIEEIMVNGKIVKDLETLPKNTECLIFKLPSKPRRKFPRKMMVSNDRITWNTRTVIGRYKELLFQYVAIHPYDMRDSSNLFISWKYAKEID